MFKKFYLTYFFLISIFFIGTGCGQFNNEEIETGKLSVSDESTFVKSNVSVKLLSEQNLSSNKFNKPYNPSLIRIQVFNKSKLTLAPISIDIFPPFIAGINLEFIIGDVYDFYATAYSDTSGMGTVLYSGNLKNELIKASTSETIILLYPQVTPSPSILSSSYLNETTSKVMLTAEINPNGNYTVAYFEWGADSMYGNKTMINTLGILETPVAFSELITGLSPKTTYYFRVVAESSGNMVFGLQQVFTTKLDTTILSWKPPATDERGNILTDLAGYKIFHHTGTETNQTVIYVINPPIDTTTGLATYTISDLPPGIHYFNVTAYDFLGNESLPSNEVSKIIN